MHAPPLSLVLPVLALPYFTEATANLGPQACGGGGCYTNYAVLADVDGDGDLDVLFPNADGYFSQGSPEPLVILANDSSAGFTDVSASAVGGFTGYLRQVALGDVDGDEDLDLYAPDAWGADDAFFVNDGNGAFTDEAASRLSEQSHAGAARFGDVDGDGDLDLVVSDWGSNAAGAGATNDAHLYLNDGAGFFTAADGQLPVAATLDGTVIDLDFFDADGDFDLDLLLDSHDASERLWLNDGAGTFTDASAAFPDGDNLSYGPGVCDVDGDGDLDVIVDNALGVRSEQLLLNGGGTFTDESDRLPTQTDDDNGVACVDVDVDGDFDLVIPSLSGNERILVNDATGTFSALTGGFPTVADATLGMDFGDLNGDGRLDAVSGQGETGSFVNRLYLGTTDQPMDVLAPVFRAVQVRTNVPPGTALTVRFAVQDSHVTDLGPRLQRAWLVYVVNSSAALEQTADFVGGDLFQAQSAPVAATGSGHYHVCARDIAGNEACSTPELAFTIAPGDDDDDDDDDDDGGQGGGCGCRTATSSGPSATDAVLLGALALLLAGWHRR